MEDNPLKAQCLRFSGGELCGRPYDHPGDCDFSNEPTSDVDPDEIGTFGEYLDAYTARGGMTDDERSAFWQSWSRHTIAWALVLVGGVTFMESFDGLAGDAGLFVAVYAALVLGWQAVEAVRFRWQARRW